MVINIYLKITIIDCGDNIYFSLVKNNLPVIKSDYQYLNSKYFEVQIIFMNLPGFHALIDHFYNYIA